MTVHKPSRLSGRPALIFGFHGLKRLKVFLLPPLRGTVTFDLLMLIYTPGQREAL